MASAYEGAESVRLRNNARLMASLRGALVGQAEGGQLDVLWRVCHSAGYTRVEFDLIVEAGLRAGWFAQSYDRIYVPRGMEP